MTEHGAIIVDGLQAASTNRCPHCGSHFLVSRGNLELARHQLGSIARPKVHCRRCNRLTCGRPGCDPALACIPLEARLEHVEGKRTRYDESIQAVEEKGLVIL